ncbi:uncharacterized protein TRIADDRAFT_22532 [Trichoplax adhaerens]|uniref:Uncharacterized protein n=1 Tax=Trichoplax adhaerens TaxID=10228 RepID=B3RQR6_TRIAD|nr:hypothetical protein TRIADDRAFT_22532 [Trichoplax adhaerens]EDV26749.1 hypothetical protein TRIADDRAFT_22532 [Trichoplax adhaerens]|eukprot:XP_002110745.1 hypothetical protein TRIADDRAFT_22532 [Trichoplax adhaerens]
MPRLKRDESISSTLSASRQAAAFFDRYSRYECQEVLTSMITDSLLSPEDNMNGGVVGSPYGVISHLSGCQKCCLIALPVESTSSQYDLRELHQIIRELVTGIFVFNQIPSIYLEANYDQNTLCSLPPAYLDTRVGQVLINIDYALKCLWHGTYFPRDKRLKFAEKWRQALNINVASGKSEGRRQTAMAFTESGVVDLSKEGDYVEAIRIENERLERLAAKETDDDCDIRKLTMLHVDELFLRLIAKQQTMQCYNNMLVVDGLNDVVGCIRHIDQRMTNDEYRRILQRFRDECAFLQNNLSQRSDLRHQLALLKFISLMVPLLIALKKRGRIPDVNRLIKNAYFTEQLKTERDLPPLIQLENNHRFFRFDQDDFFHLHGSILIEVETPTTSKVQNTALITSFDEMMRKALSHANDALESESYSESCYMPVHEIGGQSYCFLAIELEPSHLNQVSQRVPPWMSALQDEVGKLRPRRIPMTDQQVSEQLRKQFGNKIASKLKYLPLALRACSQYGFPAIFQSVSRRCPASHIMKLDDNGLSPIHHAAIRDKPNIISIILAHGISINLRRSFNTVAFGGTPLHLAARCGSILSLDCLLSKQADPYLTDSRGWAAIHHATYSNQADMTKHLLHRYQDLLNKRTNCDRKLTPVLVATLSGALDSIICLRSLGCNMLVKDANRCCIVHTAIICRNPNVLEYLIDYPYHNLHVWEVIVDMIKSDDLEKMESTAAMMVFLSTSHQDNWRQILDHGGVEALKLRLSQDLRPLRALTTLVLKNISQHDLVKQVISENNGIPLLIKMLRLADDIILSRVAVVICNLSTVDGNQFSIAAGDGIEPLISLLLKNTNHDVLVNVVKAISLLVENNLDNQTAVANFEATGQLVKLLSTQFPVKLRAQSAAAICALATNHPKNRELFVKAGAIPPLIDLLQIRSVNSQIQAAAALEALASDNPYNQRVMLHIKDAVKPLMRLLKVWDIQVKEQAASTLWAIAGTSIRQRNAVCQRIGINTFVDLMLMKSEKLQLVSCIALEALASGSLDDQARIAEAGGIQPLIRLLRSPKTCELVLLTAIRLLGSLCIGVAHTNNRPLQNEIAPEAIPLLVEYMNDASHELIQVDSACTIACLTLNNSTTQKLLQNYEKFNYQLILQLFESDNEEVRLKAGTALTTFAFKDARQKNAIVKAGGIQLSLIIQFLESSDELFRVNAAFQMIVLAPVINNCDQVELTAIAIEQLIKLLESSEETTQILVARAIASLAHTRPGIAAAFMTCGAVIVLINKLEKSKEEFVRITSAIALGYLSFDRASARLLLTACRNSPGLYESFRGYLGDNKISKNFVDSWKLAESVGLPSSSLTKNGGPPILTTTKMRHG